MDDQFDLFTDGAASISSMLRTAPLKLSGRA